MSPQVVPCFTPRNKFVDAHNYKEVTVDVSAVSKRTHRVTVLVRTFFFYWYNGGWSPIGSIRHCGHQWPIVPSPGDYDDVEIGGMIGRGTEVLGENLPQCRLVHHKPHVLPGREPGPPR
jgi:hypothetical protein